MRAWLRGVVDAEIARRNSDGADLEECDCWLIPWHCWDDSQLAHCLAASYSLYDVATDPGAIAALREIHRACLTACCTRLGELHEAIKRKGLNVDIELSSQRTKPFSVKICGKN